MVCVERMFIGQEMFLGDRSSDILNGINKIVYKEFSEDLIEVSTVDECLNGYRVLFNSVELNKENLNVLADYVSGLIVRGEL